MRIRSHFLLLATAVLVPGFLAAAVAVEKVREGERAAALRGLRETVRATALLVDGEIQRSLGAIIRRQTRHLSRVVDDLLEVSRMLSGKIAIDRRDIDLAEIVAGRVEALRASGQVTAYRIETDLHSAWVAGDPVRTEQIVGNLIANALKYSPDHSLVRIAVSAEADRAVITVADRGVGVDAASLPRIFDAFFQGAPLPGRAASGLGIGLALVRQLVELHGGNVAVRSDGAGDGSVFTVTLPRIEPPAVDAADTTVLTASLPARVLLVEDNLDARETMAGLLKAMGYDVAQSGDGTEALAALAARQPDVVVMDIGLPGRSDYEIAREMKRADSTRDIPLIALTGYGQERDRDDAIAAGFDAHLVKPVDAVSLAACFDDQARRGARPAS